MGMTDAQMLWRVEMPLAMPEIIAGLRIATVTTVALATLAVFAGGGGLGAEIIGGHHLQDRASSSPAVDRDRAWRSSSTRDPAAPQRLLTALAAGASGD